MDSVPVTHGAAGEGPISTESKVLETGAAATQDFKPVKQICAHLNAFHAYASEPGRCVEANHYCSHLNEDFRQCILYDSPEPNARLIGIEYMVTPKIFATLPEEEKKLWHSHVFEVKSGMLIMPQPVLPTTAWEAAETKEMEQVVQLYGKVYHLWQTDRGDKVPMGEPQLMTSFTARDQFEFDRMVGERDERFGVSSERKREKRSYIEEPKLDEAADATWKGGVEKKKTGHSNGGGGVGVIGGS